MASNKALVKLKDLPPHLRFNPYIQDSYRPPMNTNDCVKSLFCYGHNETFNIYSHLLFLTYFLLSYHEYHSLWTGTSNYVVFIFAIIQYTISTVPFILSMIYHSFMCHHGGQGVYKRILLLDVFGVWCLATFGEIHIIYVTLFNYRLMRTLGISIYLILSFMALSCLMLSHKKTLRSILFAAQFVFRVIFLFIRHSPYGCGPSFNYNYITMEILMMTGFLFNALNVPERWWAGPKIDYCINGHSIMHVLCGIGVLIGRNGFFKDMKWVLSSSQF